MLAKRLSETDREKYARKNLVMKLALEGVFESELQNYFNKVLKDTTDIYSSTLSVPNPSIFNNLTTELLVKHYNRTASIFIEEGTRAIIKDQGGKVDNRLDEIIVASGIAGAFLYAKQQVSKRSGYITDTTRDNIQDSFKKAKEQVIVDLQVDRNINQNNATKKYLYDNLKDKFEGRISSIKITETQLMAEKTKLIDAYVRGRLASNINASNYDLDEIPDQFIELLRIGESTLIKDSVSMASGNVDYYSPDEFKKMRKSWSAILDDVVRNGHALANGQERYANEPFEVSGELLMIPSDTSFGASIENIINCRCSALYYQ